MGTFNPHIGVGDTVAVASRRGSLRGGTLPNGSTGVVRELMSVPDAFSNGDRVVVAKVFFHGFGDHIVSLNVLTKISDTFSRDAISREKARALSDAHERLSLAYRELAGALDRVREVEAR